MPMKKHIWALVYVAIMFIMLWRVQQLENSCNVQRSWECEEQICKLCPTRSRCSNIFIPKIYRIDTSRGWISWDMFLSHNKYHMNLITAKESNHETKTPCGKNSLYGTWRDVCIMVLTHLHHTWACTQTHICTHTHHTDTDTHGFLFLCSQHLSKHCGWSLNQNN